MADRDHAIACSVGSGWFSSGPRTTELNEHRRFGHPIFRSGYVGVDKSMPFPILWRKSPVIGENYGTIDKSD